MLVVKVWESAFCLLVIMISYSTRFGSALPARIARRSLESLKTATIGNIGDDCGGSKRLLTLRFDGGSRGNPGVAGSGAVLYTRIIGERAAEERGGEGRKKKKEMELWSGYFYLGDNVTNNVAEYKGLIEGLKAAAAFQPRQLQVEGDSMLVIQQTQGEWKVKSSNLIPFHMEAQQLVKSLQESAGTIITMRHIPRELNARADELANIAIETKKDWTSPMNNIQH